MSETEAELSRDRYLNLRAVRILTGVLVMLWLFVQVGAIVVAFVQWHDTDLSDLQDDPAEAALYTHRFGVALGTAVLVMLFVAGEAAIILNLGWARQLVFLAAILQILTTVGTQIWEATLPVPEGYPASRNIMMAFIGVVVWNILPVAILVFAAAWKQRVRVAPEGA